MHAPNGVFATVVVILLAVEANGRILGGNAPNTPKPREVEARSIESLALVGESMQQVLLSLPPPRSVSLAGADAELPHPSLSDPVVFNYDLEVELAGTREVWVSVLFDPNTYRVESVNATLPERLSFDVIIEAMGDDDYRRERRKVEQDDFDRWIAEEIDASGRAEVIVFPKLGLEISRIDDMPHTGLRFLPKR